ncbi:MAG TPA: hypothetical protein VEL51_21185 [Vicinamibacterales bacterium]|nr:hypothetical protein [Vicinamibacterales bacterium]
MRHFHAIARRDHGITVSYSFVKHTLQAAGLVKRRRARGRHRRRREPRACFGELLHLDGSTHPWLALRPDERQTLIAVPDDATNQVLHAALYRGESTQAVMTALAAVFRAHGLPMALYTDRAHWAFHTPTAKGATSTRPASPKSAEPWRSWASSTFPPTRRTRAAAASGSTARFRIASSTSCARPGLPQPVAIAGDVIATSSNRKNQKCGRPRAEGALKGRLWCSLTG